MRTSASTDASGYLSTLSPVNSPATYDALSPFDFWSSTLGKKKSFSTKNITNSFMRITVHVVDLAKGHVKALKKLEDNSGLSIYNLGTGKGYSVLDIVKNFEAATGVKIPYVIKPRRPGDIATCYSDATKAEKELGWKAENGIREMCADSWRWQSQNPNGYEA